MLSNSVRLADCGITFNVFFYRTSRCWAVLCYSPWTSCKWWIVNAAFMATFSYACPRNVNIGCEPARRRGREMVVFETLPPWPGTALSDKVEVASPPLLAFPPVELQQKSYSLQRFAQSLPHTPAITPLCTQVSALWFIEPDSVC